MNAEELSSLDECRERIDQIDRELVGLLNERARVSLQVGRLKADDGTSVYRPEREAQVLRNVEAASEGPLGGEAVRNIWAEVLSSSRALQRPLRVGFLAPAGTFSHEAALAAIRQFGRSTELVPLATIPEVINATARREVEYGVVPVENTINGGVPMALDTLIDVDVQACAEIQLPVVQNLASTTPLDAIRKVYSQPVALAQVRGWLSRHLPHAEIVEVSSTGRAVELGKEPGAGGVGPEAAAELYDVPIVARNIQDQANNVTRFLVVGLRAAGPTGRDKTGLVFGVKHRAGALHDALRVFASRGLNLTWIESRPSRRQAWEYVLVVDVQGHQDDPNMRAALHELHEHAQFVKVFGSWPEAPAPDRSARVGE
jgi:chorismate mutase / prephenate dehydratase